MQQAGRILTELEEYKKSSPNLCAVVIASDFNQARARDKTAEDWSVVSRGLNGIGEPTDDGVCDLLTQAGFVCSYDIDNLTTNYRSEMCPAAPISTHWTSTVLDFAYLWARSTFGDETVAAAQSVAVDIAAIYVIPSSISDHLPIISDISLKL